MKQLADDGTTMVVVTHEMGSARDVADAVIVMDGARVVEIGSPQDLLDHPHEARKQVFLRRVQKIA